MDGCCPVFRTLTQSSCTWCPTCWGQELLTALSRIWRSLLQWYKAFHTNGHTVRECLDYDPAWRRVNRASRGVRHGPDHSWQEPRVGAGHGLYGCPLQYKLNKIMSCSFIPMSTSSVYVPCEKTEPFHTGNPWAEHWCCNLCLRPVPLKASVKNIA